MSNIIEAMPGLTFGCDPELFVFNTKKNKYVTAEGLIPGTKEEPFKVPNGAVQVDGMAAEFNIDPVDNFTDFRSNIRSVMKTLREMLPQDHELRIVPAVVFDKEEWDAAPAFAKKLGCSPDFNAWTGQVNKPPKDPENPTLRTASGHIHIGWTNDADMSDLAYVTSCRDLVKQLDWFLGGWSLQVDTDPTRRRLYGKAGAMRYKPYGVEYRVLSNFWLQNDSRMRAAWNRLQKGIWSMKDNYLPGDGEGTANTLLIHCLNTSTRDKHLESAYRFPLKTLIS